MAQKKNKDRKQQLVNYKQKIKKAKMADQQNELQQLRQYPIWSSKETIEMTGLEWESIYNLLNLFKQGIIAGESVMQRNIQKGKITMKYLDENNQEVAPEQVEEYTKKLQDFFAKRAEEEAKAKKSVNSNDSTASAEVAEAPKENPDANKDNKNNLKAV